MTRCYIFSYSFFFWEPESSTEMLHAVLRVVIPLDRRMAMIPYSTTWRAVLAHIMMPTSSSCRLGVLDDGEIQIHEGQARLTRTPFATPDQMSLNLMSYFFARGMSKSCTAFSASGFPIDSYNCTEVKLHAFLLKPLKSGSFTALRTSFRARL